MKLSERIKPVSYFKANAAEVIKTVNEVKEPYIITQNGHAKAILWDIDRYEEMQETLALLKRLATGSKEIEDGEVLPVKHAFVEIKKRIKTETK